MGEIYIIALVIVVPIVLVAYLVIWLVFRQLEKTFTGKIILGSLMIGGGMFLAVAFQTFEIAGIVLIVLGIIWILIEVLKQKKIVAPKE